MSEQIRQGDNLKLLKKIGRLTSEKKPKQITLLDHRVYQRDKDLYYPSVTTILQYMPKNKFFLEWLKDVGHTADIILERAGKEGTQVHDAAEKLVKGETVTWIDSKGNIKYSEGVWLMINKFHEFWTTYKPELLFSEQILFSDEYKYAGTGDLLVVLDGKIWLIDIKTSNTISKTFELQLAAYKKAIEERVDIKIEKTGILWLKAATRKPATKPEIYQGEGWQIKEGGDTEKNFELFKMLYEFYKLDHPVIEPLERTYPTSLSIKL